jgi:hypothetical protein
MVCGWNYKVMQRAGKRVNEMLNVPQIKKEKTFRTQQRKSKRNEENYTFPGRDRDRQLFHGLFMVISPIRSL